MAGRIQRRHFLGGALGVAATAGGSVLLPRAAGADPASTTIFADFEAKSAADSITFNSPQTDQVLWTDAVVSQGSHGIEYRVAPQGTPSASPIPQVDFHAGTGFTKMPWSGHKILSWDVMSDSPTQFLGRVTVKDTSGRSWGHGYYIPPFSQHSFDAYVADIAAAGVDVNNIAEIDMSLPRQRWPIRVFFDTMRLVDEWPYDHSPYVAAATPGLIGLLGLGPRIQEQQTRLHRLRSEIQNSGQPADTALRAQADALDSALTDLAHDAAQPDLDLATAQELYQQLQITVGRIDRLATVIEIRRNNRKNPDFGVATADSMTLVYPRDKPFDLLAPPAQIRLARGEFQSAQAVVAPYAKDLTGVTVAVTSISGPDHGHGLTAEVHPVGFLDTTPSPAYNSSSDPTGWYTGWIADPIRTDLGAIDVKAGDFQPFWVDLHAAADAQAGTYSIGLRVTAQNSITQDITLRANVWPYQIADRPKLTTSFTFNPAILGIVYGVTDPDVLHTMTRRYDEFLELYKMEPDSIYAGTPPTVEDLLWVKERWGLRHFNVLYLYTNLLDPKHPELWQAQIDKWLNTIGTAMEEYEKAGLADLAYVYGFDEARADVLPGIKATLTQLKQRFPDLPFMSTLRDSTMGPGSGLTGLVDIWSPQMDLYQQGPADAAHARGDQVYWYPDIATGHPYPNWYNGYPPIDTRMMMGPMSYQAGVDGVLYYNIARWVNHGPLTDGIFSNWNPATFDTTAGDGSLFYPGADGQPLPSIRLSNWRDGMQDYNALSLLADRIDAAEGHRPPGDIARAKTLLSARDVVQSDTNYTEDVTAYRKWRAQVADSIVRLA